MEHGKNTCIAIYLTNLLSADGKIMPCIKIICMRLIMFYRIKINMQHIHISDQREMPLHKK